jgi:hypothetical protein
VAAPDYFFEAVRRRTREAFTCRGLPTRTSLNLCGAISVNVMRTPSCTRFNCVEDMPYSLAISSTVGMAVVTVMLLRFDTPNDTSHTRFAIVWFSRLRDSPSKGKEESFSGTLPQRRTVRD